MLASLSAAFLALLWSLAGCACRPHAQSIDRPYAVPAPRPALRLALGGDVMFGRVTADGWREHGGREPFGAWAAALQAADVAFVNLEMGVCEQGPTESLLPLLWAPARSLQALSNAGIDAVSVANNHALDCGEDGLKRTLTVLRERGIAAVGVTPTGSVAVGKDVVFVGATFEPPRRSNAVIPVVLRQTAEQLHPANDFIERVREERFQHPNSLLVVSLHWGQERVSRPAAWQATFARRLIDAGANVIAGHGSHTRQPRENYAGGVILYGLGNLVFDDRTQLGHPQPPVLLEMQRTEHGWRALE